MGLFNDFVEYICQNFHLLKVKYIKALYFIVELDNKVDLGFPIQTQLQETTFNSLLNTCYLFS